MNLETFNFFWRNGSSQLKSNKKSLNLLAITGAIDNTVVNVISVENSSYTNSTQVQTTVTGSTPTTPTPTPTPSLTGKILVSTNRYVVLDDPNTGSFSGTGFKNPSRNWGTNNFNGAETNITMWALVIDGYGMPLANSNVNFTLTNPGGTADYSIIKPTDSNGLVNITRDPNAKNYYGNWKVTAIATALGVSDDTSFIYNWWGCAGGAGCGGHGSESLSSGAAVNSPYSSGHDAAVSSNSAHYSNTSGCMFCHLSYNGQGSTPSMKTADVHRNLTCDNSNCHGSFTSHRTNMVLGSCSNCHNRTDLTKKTTLNGIVSNYSTTSDYHDTNSTIPCIICHGPMHNITKPDESQRFVKNNITEDTQCTTCHQNYNKHNRSVNCTVCHSDDVHVIQVFSQNAGYVNRGSPVQGNCTNCHQNSTFLNALNSSSRAGSYFGKQPPQIPDPLKHSADILNGSLWGQFWTSETGSCYYCHGDVKHNSTALGIVNNLLANPTNVRNGATTTTTWCADCHNTGRIHNSTLAKPVSNDALCSTCHGPGGTASTNKKVEHKNLYCTECHANNTDGSKAGKDIHGIKFLQKDNTFSQSKVNGVDCTTCHQSNTVDSSFGTFTAEKVGGLHHSDNIANGTRWDSYWNTPVDACLYCHNDTRHNATPLGRPLVWNPSYVLNTVIGSGTNCADCHYKGDTNYASMGSAFTTAGKLLPPEITNGSWNGKSGYYNHSLNEYTDVQCKGCHYKGTGSTVGQMLHDVSEGGGGGPDCKSCHDAGSTSASKLVNFSAMNSSGAGHKNLNSGASATVDTENKKCWACHGDGTQPSGHPAAYKTPVECQNCHTGAGSFSAPIVAEHQQAGQDVITAVNCTSCHDNNGMYISGTGVGTINHYVKDVTDKATTPYGHFGTINTYLYPLP